MLCQFLTIYICLLTVILSPTSLAIILFFPVAYLLERGRNTPKDVGDLSLVCMLLYLILVQLFEYIYIYRIVLLHGTRMLLKIRGDYVPGILGAGEKKLPHACIYCQNAQYVRLCLHASYIPSLFGA